MPIYRGYRYSAVNADAQYIHRQVLDAIGAYLVEGKQLPAVASLVARKVRDPLSIVAREIGEDEMRWLWQDYVKTLKTELQDFVTQLERKVKI